MIQENQLEQIILDQRKNLQQRPKEIKRNLDYQKRIDHPQIIVIKSIEPFCSRFWSIIREYCIY